MRRIDARVLGALAAAAELMTASEIAMITHRPFGLQDRPGAILRSLYRLKAAGEVEPSMVSDGPELPLRRVWGHPAVARPIESPRSRALGPGSPGAAASPHDPSWSRGVAVRRSLASQATVIRGLRGGNWATHRGTHWSPFDNAAMLDVLSRATRELAAAASMEAPELIDSDDVDCLLISAGWLGRRGLHSSRSTATRTQRVASAAAAELNDWQLNDAYAGAFTARDVDMVYELLLGQSPESLDGRDDDLPSTASETAVALLGDAVLGWTAHPRGVGLALMDFLEAEVHAGRLQQLTSAEEIAELDLSPDDVRQVLDRFHERLRCQEYLLDVSARRYRDGVVANLSVTAAALDYFDQAQQRGEPPGVALYRIARRATQIHLARVHPRASGT